MKIVTSAQMRLIEERCEASGVSTDTLMERAGLAVARRVRHHLGHLAGVHVLVLVGRGNNGADGLVAAAHLRRWGADVTAYVCLERPAPDAWLDRARASGVVIIHAASDDTLQELNGALDPAHAVIDAVLGTGRSRPIEGRLGTILQAVGDSAAKRYGPRVISVDLPSGLDADTGVSDPSALDADVTVALGYPKLGLYSPGARERSGEVEVADIGIPAGMDDNVTLRLMSPERARTLLPERPATAHKGDFGRVLMVAGSSNYVGAAYLAASAATRVGAGLVTLAVPAGILAAVAGRAAEPTYLPLPESEPGELDAGGAAALIARSLPGYHALLVGCGLGQTPATKALVRRLLCSGAPLPPTVVDADGLNILASQGDGWWERLSASTVVTPHPGEMSRLTGASTVEIKVDRAGYALCSAAEWNTITVLKGAHTVVATPEGRAAVSPYANAGLASAGTGDVLAGVVAGLISQGVHPAGAAELGVFLHGEAGERVRDDLGAAGMIASDLLTALPGVIRDLASGD